MSTQRQSRKLGKFGEQVAERELRRWYAMVEKVETPWRIHRGPRGRITNATPVTKVAGDFRAVERGTGRSVLVECKARSKTLPWSAFEPHQREALTEHHEAGGISLVAWFDPDLGSVELHEWPVEGFGPRKSIKHEG